MVNTESMDAPEADPERPPESPAASRLNLSGGPDGVGSESSSPSDGGGGGGSPLDITALCRSGVPLVKLQDIRFEAKRKPPSADAPAPKKRLLCLYCDRTFVTVSLRQKHVDRCHSAKSARRSSTRFQSKTPTVCIYCKKLNNAEHTLSDLFRHLVDKHPNKYFACVECEERFAFRESLEEHNYENHGFDSSDPRLRSKHHRARKKDDIVAGGLRKRKVSVKSTKSGVKKQQAPSGKTRKRKKAVEAEEKEKSCVNPYPTFDAFFRVKKITDHSIDNLKISSLTFDDVFDKAFFNRIKCNIQENLQNHIDGKLFNNEESESRISNFEKMQEINSTLSENFGCDLTLNAATPVVSLLSSQLGEDLESQIEYGAKASKKKVPVKKDEVNYKYFTRRKYQASILENKENRDLSKLDMWTQLLVKDRQQKIINDQKSDKEKIEYTKGIEYKTKMQNDELNRILDRRGPFEDLKEEANKMAALEKINRLGESASHVSSILDEIFNKVFEKEIKKELEPDRNHSQSSHASEETSEIPFYLNLQKTSLQQEDIDRSDKITLICSSQETENFELTQTPRDKDTLVELTGEWARTRLYICAACGAKMSNMKFLLDHKSAYHPNVWVQHYEFVGNQSDLYRHLSIPGLGKVGHMEEHPPPKIWKRSDARTCTKCWKVCNSLAELHRHVLECGEDWGWMLARKKLKYRPFGSKSRKKRRGLVKRIIHKDITPDGEPRPKRKYNVKPKHEGPRQRPSDAETIQRMLANLPAKRATRKLVSLKDGISKPRRKKLTEPTPPTQPSSSAAPSSSAVIPQQQQQANLTTESSSKSGTSGIIRKSVRNVNKMLDSAVGGSGAASVRVKCKLKVRSKRGKQTNAVENSSIEVQSDNVKKQVLKDLGSEVRLDESVESAKTERSVDAKRSKKRSEENKTSPSLGVFKNKPKKLGKSPKQDKRVSNIAQVDGSSQISDEILPFLENFHLEERENDRPNAACIAISQPDVTIENTIEAQTFEDISANLGQVISSELPEENYQSNEKTDECKPNEDLRLETPVNKAEIQTELNDDISQKTEEMNRHVEIESAQMSVQTENEKRDLITEKVDEIITKPLIQSKLSDSLIKKSKKKPKGLNDCIAMLTSKLQQKGDNNVPGIMVSNHQSCEDVEVEKNPKIIDPKEPEKCLDLRINNSKNHEEVLNHNVQKLESSPIPQTITNPSLPQENLNITIPKHNFSSSPIKEPTLKNIFPPLYNISPKVRPSFLPLIPSFLPNLILSNAAFHFTEHLRKLQEPVMTVPQPAKPVILNVPNLNFNKYKSDKKVDGLCQKSQIILNTPHIEVKKTEDNIKNGTKWFDSLKNEIDHQIDNCFNDCLSDENPKEAESEMIIEKINSDPNLLTFNNVSVSEEERPSGNLKEPEPEVEHNLEIYNAEPQEPQPENSEGTPTKQKKRPNSKKKQKRDRSLESKPKNAEEDFLNIDSAIDDIIKSVDQKIKSKKKREKTTVDTKDETLSIFEEESTRNSNSSRCSSNKKKGKRSKTNDTLDIGLEFQMFLDAHESEVLENKAFLENLSIKRGVDKDEEDVIRDNAKKTSDTDSEDDVPLSVLKIKNKQNNLDESGTRRCENDLIYSGDVVELPLMIENDRSYKKFEQYHEETNVDSSDKCDNVVLNTEEIPLESVHKPTQNYFLEAEFGNETNKVLTYSENINSNEIETDLKEIETPSEIQQEMCDKSTTDIIKNTEININESQINEAHETKGITSTGNNVEEIDPLVENVPILKEIHQLTEKFSPTYTAEPLFLNVGISDSKKEGNRTKKNKRKSRRKSSKTSVLPITSPVETNNETQESELETTQTEQNNSINLNATFENSDEFKATPKSRKRNQNKLNLPKDFQLNIPMDKPSVQDVFVDNNCFDKEEKTIKESPVMEPEVLLNKPIQNEQQSNILFQLDSLLFENDNVIEKAEVNEKKVVEEKTNEVKNKQRKKNKKKKQKLSESNSLQTPEEILEDTKILPDNSTEIEREIPNEIKPNIIIKLPKINKKRKDATVNEETEPFKDPYEFEDTNANMAQELVSTNLQSTEDNFEMLTKALEEAIVQTDKIILESLPKDEEKSKSKSPERKRKIVDEKKKSKRKDCKKSKGIPLLADNGDSSEEISKKARKIKISCQIFQKTNKFLSALDKTTLEEESSDSSQYERHIVRPNPFQIPVIKEELPDNDSAEGNQENNNQAEITSSFPNFTTEINSNLTYINPTEKPETEPDNISANTSIETHCPFNEIRQEIYENITETTPPEVNELPEIPPPSNVSSVQLNTNVNENLDNVDSPYEDQIEKEAESAMEMSIEDLENEIRRRIQLSNMMLQMQSTVPVDEIPQQNNSGSDDEIDKFYNNMRKVVNEINEEEKEIEENTVEVNLNSKEESEEIHNLGEVLEEEMEMKSESKKSKKSWKKKPSEYDFEEASSTKDYEDQFITYSEFEINTESTNGINKLKICRKKIHDNPPSLQSDESHHEKKKSKRSHKKSHNGKKKRNRSESSKERSLILNEDDLKNGIEKENLSTDNIIVSHLDLEPSFELTKNISNNSFKAVQENSVSSENTVEEPIGNYKTEEELLMEDLSKTYDDLPESMEEDMDIEESPANGSIIQSTINIPETNNSIFDQFYSDKSNDELEDIPTIEPDDDKTINESGDNEKEDTNLEKVNENLNPQTDEVDKGLVVEEPEKKETNKTEDTKNNTSVEVFDDFEVPLKTSKFRGKKGKGRKGVKNKREKLPGIENLDEVYCDICNRSFTRMENLVKHKRTLTHIAKLSEIEAREAEIKAKLLAKEQKEKCSETNVETDLHKLEETFPFSMKSTNNTLNLVDIINDVLDKPIENDKKFPSTNVETKRYKSLGERKSFESDIAPTPYPFNSIPITNEISPKIPNATVLKQQLTILENIIERGYIDDITESSNKSSLSENKSDNFFMKPTLDHFVKPVNQYEEISNDSLSVKNQFEEQSMRKVLNRDEALFLECCSLLKSSSEVSDFSKKSSKQILQNTFDVKQSDEPEWLETKSLNERNGYENSCPNTPLGDGFGDEYSNTNSNTIATDWSTKQREKSDEAETEQCLRKDEERSFRQIVDEKEFDEDQSENEDCVISIETNNTDGNKVNKKGSSKFGKFISRTWKKSFEMIKKNNNKMKQKQQTSEIIQTSITDYAIPLTSKSEELDNKKVMTKGAMKVFEGLKVSIPTNDLDLKELLNGNYAPNKDDSKLKELPPFEEEHPKNLMENRNKIMKTFGNSLGLKITKKKPLEKIKDDSNPTIKDDEKKNHDVYDFEETQDNSDLFGSKLATIKEFRNKEKEKKLHEVILPEKDGGDVNEESESECQGWLDNFGFDAQSVSSYSSESTNLSVNQSGEKNITKKKCMIVGRIFKNALKANNVKDLPMIDNTKFVEDYVNTLPDTEKPEKGRKLSQEEMDDLFNKLLDDTRDLSKPEIDEPKLPEIEKTNSTPKPERKKINSKSAAKRKRPRNNSVSTDDEFSLSKPKRTWKKKAKNVDNSINLEQELRECIGVASRKSQRTCTSGKQNVLVEYWSSDDSNFEAFIKETMTFESKPKSSENSEPPPPPPPRREAIETKKPKVQETEKPSVNKTKPKTGDKSKTPGRRKSTSAVKTNKSKKADDDPEDKKLKKVKVTGETLASNRRKRQAVDTLYYWSSSSEDESRDFVETKPIRDEIDDDDDDDDIPVQHGWIVGESTKKLVTMLAQAKGKKTETDCVKEQGRKRTTV